MAQARRQQNRAEFKTRFLAIVEPRLRSMRFGINGRPTVGRNRSLLGGLGVIRPRRTGRG